MEAMAIGALVFSAALALYAAYVMRKASEYVKRTNRAYDLLQHQFDELWSAHNHVASSFAGDTGAQTIWILEQAKAWILAGCPAQDD